MFRIHTFTLNSDIPIRLHWLAEKNNAEKAPNCSPKDDEEEGVAVVPCVWDVGEDAQILNCEGRFHEVDGELVEEGLCEDELSMLGYWRDMTGGCVPGA
jgi:hypothetical protein